MHCTSARSCTSVIGAKRRPRRRPLLKRTVAAKRDSVSPRYSATTTFASCASVTSAGSAMPRPPLEKSKVLQRIEVPSSKYSVAGTSSATRCALRTWRDSLAAATQAPRIIRL
ncbi:hypothetical protein D9M72_526580 [compost metagenome]